MVLLQKFFDMISSLNRNEVPKEWNLSKYQNKGIEIKDWMKKIKRRYDFLNNWILEGYSNIYDLSLLSNEKLFMTLLPIYFQKKLGDEKISSDKIKLHFKLTKYDKPIDVTEEVMYEFKKSNNDNDFIFIRGLKLKGFESYKEEDREIKTFKENEESKNDYLPIVVITYSVEDYQYETMKQKEDESEEEEDDEEEIQMNGEIKEENKNENPQQSGSGPKDDEENGDKNEDNKDDNNPREESNDINNIDIHNFENRENNNENEENENNNDNIKQNDKEKEPTIDEQKENNNEKKDGEQKNEENNNDIKKEEKKEQNEEIKKQQQNEDEKKEDEIKVPQNEEIKNITDKKEDENKKGEVKEEELKKEEEKKEGEKKEENNEIANQGEGSKRIVVEETHIQSKKMALIETMGNIKNTKQINKEGKETTVKIRTKVKYYKKHCRLEVPFIEEQDPYSYNINEPYGYIELRFDCDKDKQEEYFKNKQLTIELDK